MHAFDQLNLIAEIAAALLGFIAVFLALSRSDGRFSQSDRHFVQALVLSSSLAIILALAPRSISLFVSATAVWVISAVLALVLGAVAAAVQIRLQLKMSRAEAAQIHWGWHVGAWSIAIASTAFFVSALFVLSKATAFYVAGVSMQIALALCVFIGVVFRRFF